MRHCGVDFPKPIKGTITRLFELFNCSIHVSHASLVTTEIFYKEGHNLLDKLQVSLWRDRPREPKMVKSEARPLFVWPAKSETSALDSEQATFRISIAPIMS